MKTVALIVPSQTYRADAYLNAASRLGVDVVTISDTGQAMSSVMGDHFLQVPLDNPRKSAEMIVELASRVHLDGIVAVDDGGALSTAYAAEQLGLVHNDPIAVEATRNKRQMRALVSNATVVQPNYRVITNDDVNAIGALVADAADEIGYPVVIKPAGLSASRGVIRADNRVQAEAAGTWSDEIAHRAGSPSANTLLVEAFVAGDEVALEGRLRDGHLENLAIFDKPEPLDGPFFEETIYVRPSRLSATVQQEITDVVGRACQAMGLSVGPIHAEVRVSPSGKDASPTIVFLELAARTIGGRCAKALTFNGSMSIEEIVIADALQIDCGPVVVDEAASGVLMLPIPQAGRLIEVAHQKEAAEIPGITGVEITVAPGRVMRPFPESDRYLGFVFAQAKSSDDVVAALRSAEAILNVRVDIDDLDDGVIRR